jgi:DNA-binding CsgD family transcriptional regulator
VIQEPIGRTAERDLVERMLDSARDQEAALILGGEPGIGKTCVWRWAVGQARAAGFRVLSAEPAPSESKLAFAALGDILNEALDDMVPHLPAPQARALEVALLRRDPGDAPADLRTVSVACLSGLLALGRSDPTLVAVDDVQWLDPSTRRVLTFVARRSLSAPLSFLLTLRTDEGGAEPLDLGRVLPPAQLYQATLGPLTVAALHHVLRAHLGKPVSRALLTRIARTSGGNPFYALELARALESIGDDGSLAGQLPLTDPLRTVVGSRLASLPSSARWPSLLAAAASTPTYDLLARSSSGEAVDGCLASRILLKDRRGLITFQHPIFAAAIYQDSPPTERRRAHRQLAEFARDPEERGRHLALAAEGPDRRVARTLDIGADRARRRGATDTAAELTELARDLTPDQDGAARARRSLAMASDLFLLGDMPAARSAGEAAMADADGPTFAKALLLLARVEWLTGSSVRALELAERALATAVDPLFEADIRIQIAFLSKADRQRGRAHARKAVEILEVRAEKAAEALFARALTALAFVECDLGRPLSTRALERALALAPRREPEPVAERIGYYVGTVHWQYDDLDTARRLLEESLRSARDEGDEGSLSFVLDQLSQVEVLSGDWRAARRYALEQCEIALITEQEMEWLWGLETLASIDAREGTLEEAAARIGDVMSRSRALDDPMTTAFALRTSGFIAWSMGEAARACTEFAEATQIADHIGLLSPGGLRHEPDHAEALIELGRLDEASAVIARLATRGRRAKVPWARATSSRCMALLSAARGDLDGAAGQIATAVRQQRRLPMPFEVARTSLIEGQIHRRRRERRAARGSLDRATILFEELGALPWSARARVEADRLGLRPSPATELTPTESRVAQLAAAGLSNPEIAARLFISRKTVEFNLGKVYRKLGVRGRTELASLLGRSQTDATL